MNLFDIISKAETALRMLTVIKPLLGPDAKIVDTVAEVVGKALSGAKLGISGYQTLSDQLDGVINELAAIRVRGHVEGQDFKKEIEAINNRGQVLDSILSKLTG